MSDIDSLREAMRRITTKEGRDGNLLTLDCGHTIFADPYENEYALAARIHDHKVKHDELRK